MKKLVSLLLVLTLLLASTSAFAAETVRYACPAVEGEPWSVWLTAMCEAFTQETGIEVEVTYAGRDVLNKMKPQILIGDAPDIIGRSFEDLYAALLADEILLEPLDEFLYSADAPDGDEGKLIDIFHEDAIRLYGREGDDHIYLYPYKCNTSGFFYNKKIFEQYGIEVPATWDEFVAVCQKLKDNGVAPLTLDGNINFYNLYYFYWLCERIMGGGELLKAAKDTTGESWRQEGFLKAAELVSELAQKGFFQQGYEGSAYPAAQSDWAMGGSAMILMGSWIVVETKALIDPAGFEYGFFAVPAVEGGKGDPNGVEISYVGVGIPKDAKNKEGAKQLLRYLVSKDSMKMFGDVGDNIPARNGAIYPDSMKLVQETMEKATSFHKLYDGTSQFAAEWQANVLYPLDNELIFGTLAPADFIEKLVTTQAEFYAAK